MKRRNFISLAATAIAQLFLPKSHAHADAAAWQRDQALSYIIEEMKRSGLIEIWTYPRGDDEAKRRTIAAIKSRIRNKCDRSVIVLPRPAANFGYELIDLSPAGSDYIKSLIVEHFQQVRPNGLARPEYRPLRPLRRAKTRADFQKHWADGGGFPDTLATASVCFCLGPTSRRSLGI
jgi:hypothetical protein